jgi:integrase
MAYAEKRDGALTGYWYGEAYVKAKRFRRRFAVKKDAEGYEVYVKLMGTEPPTMEGEATSGRSFAQVAQECKDAGGPRGVWKRNRDPSIIQRVDYCVTILGHLDIINVTRKTFELVVKSLEKRPAMGKKHKLAQSTINRYLNAASAVMNYATLSDYIPAKPKVPLAKERGKLQGILSDDQEANILETMKINGDVTEAFCVLVLVETGLREGELLGHPRLGQPPLRANQITFETDEDHNENGWITLDNDEVKNDAARSVYIRPELGRELQILIRAKRLPKAFRLLKRFKRAAKTCGYPANLVIHSLRHTRNTRLRKDGTDIKVRMKMIGHKTVQASMRYDHVDTEDQLKAAKKLEKGRGDKGKTAEIVPFASKRSA